MNNKKGKLIVISAPSGAGKSSLIKAIINNNNNIELSISATTRKPREGESNAKDYFFISDEEFNALKSKDDFVECALVHNYQYGTLRSHINERIDKGINIILDIDVQGFEQIQEASIDNTSIFIIPPSIEELKKRLNIRGLDSQEVIETRLVNARHELKYANSFDFRVLNDEFDDALKSLVSIIFDGSSKDIDTEKSTKILQELLS
ncbi:guanylate kinase [Gammaproteobacteria bacterium]|nr:guanylate kinase [Gammaproteobacteria bacterium]MDA9133665.1 guanylate kinase [Gammaproteobacteria bacterium]